MREVYQNLINALEELDLAESATAAAQKTYQETSGFPPGGLRGDAVRAHDLVTKKAWRAVQRAKVAEDCARGLVWSLCRGLFSPQSPQ